MPIDSNSYRTTVYAYTPSGQKSSTDIGRCVSTDTTACTPANNSAGVWNDGGTTRYTYAPDGLNISQIGKNNASISTSYDQAGRPVKIVDPTSNITITGSYYLDGLLRAVGDGTDANTYSYNGAAVLTSRTDSTGSAGITHGSVVRTSYSYNDAGLPAQMTSDVHAGDFTTMAYDPAGRLVTQVDSGGGTGQTISNRYNPDNTLSFTKVTVGSTVVANDAYGYDNAGNILSHTVTGSAQSYTDSYSYNPAQNITSYAQTAAGTTTTTAYTWDHDGNRLTAAATIGTGSASTTSYTYNADNSIASQTAPSQPANSYTYDNAGLLTNDGCNTYGYDDFDRTNSVTSTGTSACGNDPVTTTYSYDGLDRQRNSAVTGSTTSAKNKTTLTAYDGFTSSVVGQTTATAGNNAGPDTLYQLDPSGSPTAILQTPNGGGTSVASLLDDDGNSNVSLLIDTANSGSDAVGCAANYDPYGNPVLGSSPPTSGNGVCASGADASTTGNAYWYRNQRRDGTTGTYQLGTRTYNPASGSYTGPDNYRVGTPSTDLSVGTDPLTANTYSYVNGNPINYGDPDGHCPIDDDNKCVAGYAAITAAASIRQTKFASQAASINTATRRISTALAAVAFMQSYYSGVNRVSVFPALPYSYKFCGFKYANTPDSDGPFGPTSSQAATANNCTAVPAGQALEITRNQYEGTDQTTGVLKSTGTWSDTFRFGDPAKIKNGYGKLQVVKPDGTLNQTALSAVIAGTSSSYANVELDSLKDSNSGGFDDSRTASVKKLESEYDDSVHPGLSRSDKVGLGLGGLSILASAGALALPEGIGLAVGTIGVLTGAASTAIDIENCDREGGPACGSAELGVASAAFGTAGVAYHVFAAVSTVAEASTAALTVAGGLDRAALAAGGTAYGADAAYSAPTLTDEVNQGLGK